MDERLREFAESTFKLEENEGEDKVISLEEAIRRNVKPGMVLHISTFASAALREILRQFWGTKPEFTLFAPPRLGSDLVHCGLVKKIIGGEGDVAYEIWSLAGISQRLLAGALGTGFIPTKSMMGTDIAEDNKDSFKVIDDPFGSGKTIGIIKAFNPDLTIVHGWASDRYGNTILPPSEMHVDEWSALASKNEVVVTVERLVSTAFIREHSPLLVKIPGYRVNSVSVVPFGAHPGYMTAWRGEKEFETYGMDSEFSAEHQKAARDPKTLDAWIKEWVLDCPSHEDYLRKLGNDRLQALISEARVEKWESRLPFILEKVSPSLECNEREAMIVAAARKIKEAVIKRDYKVVVCGAGTAGLAPFLAYYQLKEEDYHVALMVGNGVFDFAPRPGEPALTSFPNWDTCKIRGHFVWAYNLIVFGENQRSLSLLSAAQIDKFGNMNSGVEEGGKIFLSAPGGAADAYQANETMAVIAQSKNRFLEKVSYITSPGDRVKTLVSTLGVFEKLGDDEAFSLTACLPNPNLPTLEEKISNIKENCGWELKVALGVKEIPPPTFEELMTLRILDPDDLISGETRQSRRRFGP